jgi:acetate kinase
VTLDPSRNRALVPDGEIGEPGGAVRTLVVAAREDIEIARQVRALIGKSEGESE